jgi:hypothetical protein
LGLDTYAVTLSDGEVQLAPDWPFEGLRLCDGWGSSMFRGKVYAEVVEGATGQSLYQQRIDPETVAEMAKLFRAAVEEAKRAGKRAGEREVAAVDERGDRRIKLVEIPILEVAGCEIHAEEAEDLARWFEICAEGGYAIEGWW